MESRSLAIIASQPDLPALPILGKAFAEIQQIPLLDGSRAAKSTWGILAENIPEDKAPSLLEIFRKCGVDVLALPMAELPAHRPPHPLSHIRPMESGLEVAANPNEWKRIPWEAIAVFGAAVFHRKILKTIKEQTGPSAGEKIVKAGILLTTGLPIPLSKKKDITLTKEESEYEYLLDIFLRRPEIRIRLLAGHMDYNFLNEKRQFGSESNFRLMLEQLTAAAPHALKNHGAKILLNKGSISSMGYESEADLDREGRWLLALASRAPSP